MCLDGQRGQAAKDNSITEETEATNKTRKLQTMDGELPSILELYTVRKKGG